MARVGAAVRLGVSVEERTTFPAAVQVALDAAEADGLVVTRYEADWGAFAFASGTPSSGSLALLLAARFDLTWTRAPRRDLDAWWSHTTVRDHYPGIYRDTIGRFPAPARDAAVVAYAAELVVSMSSTGRLLGSYPASVEPLDPPHYADVRALLARAGWRESLRQSDNSPGSYRVWTHPDVVVPVGRAR